MENNELEAKVKERDRRSHTERLFALREAFGQLKAAAIQNNKVNECSLTKVAKLAGVNKLYLTGNKHFIETGVADKYRDVGKDVIKFRVDFQGRKDLSGLKNISGEIESELEKVKASVYQYFLQAEVNKNNIEFSATKLKNAESQIILLQAKLAELTESNSNDVLSSNVDGSLSIRLVRTIISPDRHLVVNGQYKYENESQRNQAWLKSYEELDLALERLYAKRLYILVGLPCSGKSFWAENADLYSDRHPIIFDANNLTRFSREDLIHRFRHFKDIKKCCVYFDTPISVIKQRNAKTRTMDRQLTNEDIDIKNNQLQPPNPHDEKWIEEMIVVRINDERE